MANISKKWALVALFLIASLSACTVAAPTSASAIPAIPALTPTAAAPGPTTLVLTGTLIDGTGADPLPDAVIVIQDGRITAVGPRSQVQIPANVQRMDFPNGTLLPGFINAHVHKAFDADLLKLWAQAGVTTVRDLGAPRGSPYFSTRNTWRIKPEYARVVTAGPIVTVPDGYPQENTFPSLRVYSAEDAHKKVATLIERGADVIKIALESSDGPILSPEEAAAIVETAHQRGIPVSAHISLEKDLERALDAGVDDVAHIAVDPVSDGLIQRMAQANVYWVPTLTAMDGRGFDNLRAFVEAGGQVAMGNDAGYIEGLEMGMPLRELRWMKGAGMTPMQVIVAATHNGAGVCKLEEELGTLETGKIADVLVINGDPLKDLQALEDVLLVVHAGTIIRNENR